MTDLTSPQKIESTGIVSTDGAGDNPYGTFAFLAKAAATEHALTPLQAMRTYWRAFFWCMFICTSALLFGYDSLMGGGLLGVAQFRTDFGFVAGGQPILPASWQGAFNSAGYIGGTFGGPLLGWISDRLGRRGALAFACIVSIVGVLIQFFTPRHVNGMLFVGKLVNGVSFGMFLACAGSYSAELSPLALRGVTTAAVNLWMVLGQLAANCAIRGAVNRTDVYAYRLPFALQWIFPVMLLIGLPFAPESPWWLVRNGRYEEAEKVITHLRGPMADSKLRLQQIKETIDLEDSYAATSTYVDCFRGENLRRTAVAMMVFVLQQATGVVFILGFSTYLFELAGITTNKAFDLGVGVTAIGVVGNLLTFYAVDKLGRRPLFNLGMAGCTIILFLIGFIWVRNANKNAKWAVAALTIVHNFVYQVSVGPLGFVISAEVSSAKLRSRTVGIGIWINSICGIVACIVVPYLVNPNEANLGGYVGLVFGCIALPGTIWSYFFIPETKGRTVDELDLLYERKVPARQFAGYRLYDGEGEKM